MTSQPEPTTPPVEDRLSDLARLVGLLASVRLQADQSKAHLDAMRKALEATAEWDFYSATRKDAQSAVTDLDTNIRAICLDLYHETGSKTLHPAVKVREETVVKIEDEAAVLAYCKEHLPQAFKVDWAFVEKHAKAVSGTAPMPGVAVTKEAFATIGSNLEAYIPIGDHLAAGEPEA